MRLVPFIAFCLFLGADILKAHYLWGVFKSKGFIREELLSPASAVQKH